MLAHSILLANVTFSTTLVEAIFIWPGI